VRILLADKTPVRGDFVLRAVQRFDLTPVPSSLSAVFRADDSIASRFAPGASLYAGAGGEEYEIVKSQRAVSPLIQGDTATGVPVFEVIAFPKSVAALMRPQPRAVVKERKRLGEVYRACGATVRVEQDIEIVLFACFVGDYATLNIARLLQEEAAAPVWRPGGALSFVRLPDLFTQPPVDKLAADSTQVVASPTIESLEIPNAYSVAPDGGIVAGNRQTTRLSYYLPRMNARVLNNLSRVLVTRRKLAAGVFAGHIRAGDRLDVAGIPHVVITASHAWDSGAASDGANQTTSLWLGQLA
jgi:hypothetical protein